MSSADHDALHQDGIGGPDGLERLWTPYRMAYLRGENKPADDSAGECPFCRIPRADDDERYLVVRRGELAYAVLNLYPYAPGHLMVCPYRHIADYTDTTAGGGGGDRRADQGGDAHAARGVPAPRASTSG